VARTPVRVPAPSTGGQRLKNGRLAAKEAKPPPRSARQLVGEASFRASVGWILAGLKCSSSGME
jgi:hypothetical protein